LPPLRFRTINEGKLVAPGNLRATQDNAGYAELFEYWLKNTYQLRYTGGMVPDVNQLMVKGKGVFVNVASKNTKSKLRVLYEVAPIGYLIEKV
jgi:sedoheptulose-bisphosphatase